MKLFDEIKTEHHNRTKWIDENLTARERMRIERQIAIKIFYAFVIYLSVLVFMDLLL